MIKCYAAVMQSWMSLFCNTWCPVLLHSKSKNRRFAPHGTCLVRHSNNWFHEDWSQCSISGQYTSTVLSSLILLVFVCCLQPSSPGPSYFILFSLSAFLQSFLNINSNYLSRESVHARVSIPSGMSFLSSKIVRWAVISVSFALISQAYSSHLGSISFL